MFAIVDFAFIMDELQSTESDTSDDFGNFIIKMPSSDPDIDDTN